MFWPVAGIVVATAGALVVVGLGIGDLSIGTIATASLLAMVPVVVVVAAFLWLDRWEPEPGRKLLAAFLWGAGVATLGAVVVNSLIAMTYGEVASSVVSAPLAEEALKGAFVVGLLWRHRHELDGAVDGIVYAGLVAAGFAFVENILYLGRAFDADIMDGYAVFVVRGVVSPFAHPLFTVFIGIAVGLAAGKRARALRVVLPVVGYACAVALHAVWNASALWDDGRDFVTVYVVVMVPVFLAMLALALWQRRREQRIIAAQLPSLVDAGWIPWYELELLSTLRSRRRWAHTMRSARGRHAARAVRDYQVAVTELAFVEHRVTRGVGGANAPARRAEVLESVARTKAAAVTATGAT